MKKIVMISGIFSIFLLGMIVTGWAKQDMAIKESIYFGNQQYEQANYEEALQIYEVGLAVSSQNKILNGNAAQTAYLLGAYEEAFVYYEESEDNPEKFLNMGNIFFKIGEAIQDDVNQKMQQYSQALQIYREGIMEYPQHIPLKYNYEFVKEKLEELSEQMEQEDNEQNEEDEEENQEQEEGDQGEGNEEQNEEQNEEKNEDEQGTENQEENSEQNQEQTDELDQEAIERILQMLEAQEEESLKNNQEVMVGNEGSYGW